MNEADVLGLLRAKLTRPGNGGAEYALLPQVRNAAGFDASRTFDAIAVSLWPSRGFTLHCYEVKCSRSDWLRELKEPAKAEAAAAFCDYFSVVASSTDIVRAGELPPTWGLLVVSGDKLRTVTKAPLLPNADPKRPIERTVLVPMLRSAGAAIPVAPVEIRTAWDQGAAHAKARSEASIQRLTQEFTAYRARVEVFEQAAGVKLDRWDVDPATVGTAVRAVLAANGSEERAHRQLTSVRIQLARALEAVDGALGVTPVTP